jgi:polar amino acid transport system substrate-binding protein
MSTRRTVLSLLTAAVVLLAVGLAPALAQEAASEDEAPVILQGTATDRMPDLPAAANQLDRIRRRGELRVGLSTFVPWAMNTRDGKLMGYEIDLAHRLAEDLGVELVLVPGSWSYIIEDLLDERFDMIASGMAITPKRALLVNFSVPYGHSKAMVVANRKKAANVRGVDGLNREGVVIGVYEESVNEPLARETFPKARIQTFENQDNLLAALVEGTVHAAVTASPGPEFLMHKAPEELYVPSIEPLARRGEAFAIRKGDVDFLAYLDAWVRYYTENGWLAERRHYWFETFDWEDDL